MNDDEDLSPAMAGLRQQVTALASIVGVLLAALRRGGLMTPAFESVLASELVDAAAAKSAQAHPDWKLMVSTVQKVSIATERSINAA